MASDIGGVTRSFRNSFPFSATAKFLGRPRALKRGQTLVEYALILSFISVVAIATLVAMGGQVKSAFTTISSQLATAQTGGPVGGGGGGGGGGGNGNRGG